MYQNRSIIRVKVTADDVVLEVDVRHQLGISFVTSVSFLFPVSFSLIPFLIA